MPLVLEPVLLAEQEAASPKVSELLAAAKAAHRQVALLLGSVAECVLV